VAAANKDFDELKDLSKRKMARTPEKKRGDGLSAEEAEHLAQQEERLAAYERQDEREERAARLSALPTIYGPRKEACGLDDFFEAIAPLQELADFLRQNLGQMTPTEQQQLTSKLLDHVRMGLEWGSHFGGEMQHAQEVAERRAETIHQKEETLQEQEAQIAELNETIVDMARRSARGSTPENRGTPATDATTTTGTVPRNERSSKLADPPVFYNQKEKDVLGFEAWIRQIKNKLVVNADHFPTTHAAQTYVETRIGGVAADNLQPYLRENSALQITTAEELVKHLEAEYRDPNQGRRARDAYEALRMKPSDDYLRFKNEFVRLAGECGENRAAWKDQFKRRLTTALQGSLALAYCDDAIGFEHFARVGAEVANTLSNAYKDKQASKSSNNNRLAERKNSKPAEPRQQQSDQKRLVEEKDEARCFVCGEVGHFAARCPQKKGQSEKKVSFAACDERKSRRERSRSPVSSEN
jgi:hypothetical protein